MQWQYVQRFKVLSSGKKERDKTDTGLRSLVKSGSLGPGKPAGYAKPTDSADVSPSDSVLYEKIYGGEYEEFPGGKHSSDSDIIRSNHSYDEMSGDSSGFQ